MTPNSANHSSGGLDKKLMLGNLRPNSNKLEGLMEVMFNCDKLQQLRNGRIAEMGLYPGALASVWSFYGRRVERSEFTIYVLTNNYYQ